jgi:hypothetical protein
MSTPAAEAQPAQQRNALFYVDPQPLTKQAHGDWRLKPGDAQFAAGAIGVPLVVGEFAVAGRHFPILFAAGDEASPIALTGLEDRNLFVDKGQWDPLTYVPAYVRRYPFGFVGVGNQEQPDLALAIDAGSDRFAREGTEGVPLFENGEPSQLCKDALTFCSNYAQEAQRTRAFRDALKEKGLLVDRRIDGTYPDGKKFAVNGFQIVDEKKLAELDAETVVDWHRKGWLALCYFHLASLDRVNELIRRRVQPGP